MTDAARWVPILQGRGIPGGAIPAADYAVLKAGILEGLAAVHAAEPLGGMVLDLHGAASVVGLDDMEGDLAAACREVLGPDVLISTGMDLHGNVSRRLAVSLDLLTTYRTAPRVDWLETKERAVRNLLLRLARPESEWRPYKAWVLGSRTDTSRRCAPRVLRCVAGRSKDVQSAFAPPPCPRTPRVPLATAPLHGSRLSCRAPGPRGRVRGRLRPS
ncbi:MAG: M81 family metallopeptidase [Nocardioides sp.]|uniref:M81 family metallopeptidase n=1 Tax=Nocardioides sp. TaxID=35761 RepID=UPI0039E2319F